MQILKRLLIVAFVSAPWMVSLYLHFWLEHTGVWTPDRPYRGLLSVLLLAIGMSASFGAYMLISSRYK